MAGEQGSGQGAATATYEYRALKLTPLPEVREAYWDYVRERAVNKGFPSVPSPDEYGGYPKPLTRPYVAVHPRKLSGAPSVTGTVKSTNKLPPSRAVTTPGKHMAGPAGDYGQGVCELARTGVMLFGNWALESAVRDYLAKTCDNLEKEFKKPTLEAFGALVCIHIKYTPEREGFQQKVFVGGRFVGYATDQHTLLEGELDRSSLVSGEEGWGHLYFYLWITPELAASREYRRFPIVARKDFEPAYGQWWILQLREDINNFVDDLVKGRFWKKK